MTHAPHRFASVAVTLALTLVVGSARAASIYVDNSCASDGDGTAVSCAGSNGGKGARKNLQPALDAAVADDVVEVRAGSGTYVTTAGTGYTTPTGFFFGHSGTSGHPITLRGYQNERPLLAACADGATDSATCGRNTLSIHDRSWIHVTGLRIRGMLNTRCDAATSASTLCAGLELDHLEVTQGWSSPGDGNWSGIWVSAATGARVHHNWIHGIAPLSGAGQQSSAACIKVYTGVKSTYEYNTCDGVQFSESQSGCYDDKQDACENTWRYNYCVNANGGIRLQNQAGPYSGVPNRATNVRIVQNVFVMGTAGGPRDGVRFEAAGFDGIEIASNTIVGFDHCFEVHGQNPNTTVLGVKLYDNICAGIVSNHMASFENAFAPVLYDYDMDDVATGSPRYRIGGANYATLADLQNGTAFGDGSRALATFGFGPGGTDAIPYHLGTTSPAKGNGRVGGISSGAAMDPGAYVDGITCVGWTCGAAPIGDAGVGDGGASDAAASDAAAIADAAKGDASGDGGIEPGSPEDPGCACSIPGRTPGPTSGLGFAGGLGLLALVVVRWARRQR